MHKPLACIYVKIGAIPLNELVKSPQRAVELEKSETLRKQAESVERSDCRLVEASKSICYSDYFTIEYGGGKSSIRIG